MSITRPQSSACVLITLSYQAEVCYLAYRLWERLGFTKAGRIPRAGRMKRKDGDGEEYLDAWVFFKSFIDTEA